MSPKFLGLVSDSWNSSLHAFNLQNHDIQSAGLRKVRKVRTAETRRRGGKIMRNALLFVVLMWCVAAYSADSLSEKLQRGLFEEEANRNLDAAIKEYQSVVAHSDEQRKVIATALFRLGD